MLRKMVLSTGASLSGTLGPCSASGLSSGVTGLSSLLLFLRELSDSGLGDLALLLGSLTLPGGGESDGVTANGDNLRGGKQSRDGYDQGIF